MSTLSDIFMYQITDSQFEAIVKRNSLVHQLSHNEGLASNNARVYGRLHGTVLDPTKSIPAPLPPSISLSVPVFLNGSLECDQPFQGKWCAHLTHRYQPKLRYQLPHGANLYMYALNSYIWTN